MSRAVPAVIITAPRSRRARPASSRRRASRRRMPPPATRGIERRLRRPARRPPRMRRRRRLPRRRRRPTDDAAQQHRTIDGDPFDNQLRHRCRCASRCGATGSPTSTPLQMPTRPAALGRDQPAGRALLRQEALQAQSAQIDIVSRRHVHERELRAVVAERARQGPHGSPHARVRAGAPGRRAMGHGHQRRRARLDRRAVVDACFAWFRRGRRPVQHVAPRHRDHAHRARRAAARRTRVPRSREVLALCEQMRLESSGGAFDISFGAGRRRRAPARARAARSVGPREGLGGGARRRDAPRRGRDELLRQRGRRRPRARSPDEHPPVGGSASSIRGSGTGSRPSSPSRTAASRPRAATSAATTSSIRAPASRARPRVGHRRRARPRDRRRVRDRGRGARARRGHALARDVRRLRGDGHHRRPRRPADARVRPLPRVVGEPT